MKSTTHPNPLCSAIEADYDVGLLPDWLTYHLWWSPPPLYNLWQMWVYSCTGSEIPLSNYLSPGLSVQAFICFAWLDAHEKLAWALSGWYSHFKMWRVLYNILCMLWSSTHAYAFDLLPVVVHSWCAP